MAEVLNGKHIEDEYGYNSLSPQDYHQAINLAVNKYRQTVLAIKRSTVVTWDAIVQPLEYAAEHLDRLWHLLSHENAVASTPEIRAVHDELLPLISDVHTEIAQDYELYNLYRQLQESHEFAALEQAQQSIIKHALQSFQLAGVNLPENSRKQLQKLRARLSELESEFNNNALDATEEWTYHVTTAQKFLLDGLPERMIVAAKQRASKEKKTGWVFGLDSSTFYDILSYANNRSLREEFYIAYYTRASDQGPVAAKYDNTKIIADILATRQEIAHIAGYPNYAEYALVPRMAHNVAEVEHFLSELMHKTMPYAEQEYAQLKKFAAEQGFAQELEPWDLNYYSELMRIQKYQINDEELRVYFPLPKVLQGMFALVKDLFGIKVVEVHDFKRWDERVNMYKISDHKDNVLGYFYTDLYTREGKHAGAWMSECVSRMRLDNNAIQTPIAFLNCNFPPPLSGQPGLLSHPEVTILFHEFGHTLHHILTKVEYYSVSGIAGVEHDAVELPSQFMENWAWEWQVIQNITENIYSGEQMPKEVFDNLLATKNFNVGLYLNRFLIYSIFDLKAHENTDKNKSAHQILQELMHQYSVAPVSASNRFENTFLHIFAGDDYAAGYYGYFWADVLASDAYAKCMTSDGIDKNVTEEFLVKILEKGGSLPAMDLFVDFMGRKPRVDALLRRYGLM